MKSVNPAETGPVAPPADGEPRVHARRLLDPAPAARPTLAPRIYAADGTYLGRLSDDPHDAESVSNPHGRYGDPNGNTIKNPNGKYGSRNSPTSAANPHATNPPRIYGADGKYLGKLSRNEFDPESTSNPFGKYGTPYGNTITNPNSAVGRSVMQSGSSGATAGNPAAADAGGPNSRTTGGYGKSTERSQPAEGYTPYRAPNKPYDVSGDGGSLPKRATSEKPSGSGYHYTPYRTPTTPAAPSNAYRPPTFTTPTFKAPGSTTKPGGATSPASVNPFTFKPKSLAERK